MESTAIIGSIIVFLIFGFIWWVLPVIFAVKIGNKKNRVGLGWMFGILLGWIGVIIMACLKNNDMIECPFCAEKIKRGATLCVHCKSIFTQEQIITNLKK